MRYCKNGSWHELVRITGPTHNMLALQLTTKAIKSVKVEAIGQAPSESKLESANVLRQVRSGIERANALQGTTFSVSAVRYDANDTPSDTVYRLLAQEVVKRAAAEDSGFWQLAAG